MSLDTLYRPRTFDDVLGQEEAVAVLRGFVKSGAGFYQSYVFCGQHGSGKTTMGRILARALLCDVPVNGDPCDQCLSCKSILELGTSECFTEFDAATNSGKDSIKAITSSIQYDTFSGKRRIYVIDESHRLSKDALDSLLKPMEDTVPGGEDKLLVCIFCTTEPEKMRATIFSRCAPAFVIRKVSPEKIAQRLAWVCDKEGIKYEPEALLLIAEAAESHIRDALKSTEGVSQLGDITVDTVTGYLRLNTNPMYLRILGALGSDLPVILDTVTALSELVSPATAYEKLAELAMLAFGAVTAGRKVPAYWKPDIVMEIGKRHSAHLLNIAALLSGRPTRATYAMLSCDLATLHYGRTGEIALPSESVALSLPRVQAPMAPTVQAPILDSLSPAVEKSTPAPVEPASVPKSEGRVAPVPETKSYLTTSGVHIDPRGINRRNLAEPRPQDGVVPPMDAGEFKRSLLRMVGELNADGVKRGSSR